MSKLENIAVEFQRVDPISAILTEKILIFHHKN